MRNDFYRLILGYIIKWVLISFIFGFLGAHVVVGLNLVIDTLRNLIYDNYFFSPLLGGLLVGIIIYYFDSRSTGLGTNRYIDYSKQETKIYSPIRLFTSKFANTSLTVGLMGVDGLVGPSLLIGSSLAMVVNQILNLFKIDLISEKFEYRVLSVCGAAATLGPLLGAPVGSGVFASEVLHKSSLNYDDLFPAILSGSFGLFFYDYLYGPSRLNFNIYLPKIDIKEVMIVILVALLAGFLGQVIILIYKFILDLFKKWNYSLIFKPIFAAVIITLILKFFNISGVIDKLKINEILFSGLSVRILFILLIVKVLSTTIVISSGGSVAMVDTAIVAGGLIGNLLHFIVPLPLNLLVVIVISAILASVANIPLATIILVAEMFGINLSLSIVLGSIIGFLVGRAQAVYQYIDME